MVPEHHSSTFKAKGSMGLSVELNDKVAFVIGRVAHVEGRVLLKGAGARANVHGCVRRRIIQRKERSWGSAGGVFGRKTNCEAFESAGQGTNTSLRWHVGIKNECWTMEYWDGFRFIGANTKGKVFEKAGEKGVSGNEAVELSRAVGCRYVSERSVSQVDC